VDKHTEPSSGAIAVEVVNLRTLVSLPSSYKQHVYSRTYIHDEVCKVSIAFRRLYKGLCEKRGDVKDKRDAGYGGMVRSA
jgi:hypothetical protein